MKSVKTFVYGILIIAMTVQATGCKDYLDPEVYTQIVPENLFNSLQGVESLLYGAYAKSAEMQGSNVAAAHLSIEETMADQLYAINTDANPFRTYTMDGGESVFNTLWNLPYSAIRNANILLENIDEANIDDASKSLITAEATFIRAISYYNLYMRFGPVPLRVSTTQELELTRSTDQEMIDFIATELTKSVSGLPDPGKELAYGRATKGAALGYLMKLYLNTKQWQKAADAAKEIMDMNYYKLFPDYFSLFFVANEGNKEMIWVRPAKADLGREAANTLMAFAYPPNFKSDPVTGLQFVGANFGGSNIMVYDSFYDSFDPNDKRKSLIITKYINDGGNLVDLSSTPDSRRPFKYWPDEDIQGSAFGNDIPVIRYADVLLSRAEALNEINGPNQESISLINQVRDRAGVPDLKLSDFVSKEDLRAHIFKERGWEFYLEGKARHDMIRQGTLIEKAQERGLPAKDYNVRFPIPTFALDANPKLEQNPGYQ